MKQVRWIDEKVAAQMVGRAPKYFRRMVKSGSLTIPYTTINGRNYRYSEEHVKDVFNQNAVMCR